MGTEKSAQPMGFYLGKTKCVSGSNHWIPMIWWDHNGNTWWAMKLVGCCESEVGRSRWIYIIYLYSSVLSGDTNQVLQLIPRLIYLAVISKGLSLLTWSKIHANTYRHFKEHLKWKSQQYLIAGKKLFMFIWVGLIPMRRNVQKKWGNPQVVFIIPKCRKGGFSHPRFHVYDIGSTT